MNDSKQEYLQRLSQAAARYDQKRHKPKTVILGTGDTQRDVVDKIDAGTSAVQAKHLLAEAMYKLVFPDLAYPTGNSKQTKKARYNAEDAADQVLERVGREHYKEALDACRELLINPSDRELAWREKVVSPRGLIDTVSKKVSRLRSASAQRAQTVQRNLGYEENGIVELPRPPQHEHAVPGVPDEYANLWCEAKVDLKLQLPSGTYNTWVHGTTLAEASEDSLVVMVRTPHAVEWLDSDRLRPIIERVVRGVAEREMGISFVCRDGTDHDPA